jgi:P27 family predicted phage terminase small subunit
MAGRKPKPTNLKVLEGNPGKRQLNPSEPKLDASVPKCPAWLSKEAKREWKRLVPFLEKAGLLTQADRAAFAGYCQSYANWIEAEAHLAAEGSTFETPNGYQQQSPWVSIAQTNQKNMLRFCTEFGLTPSSRSRIVVESTSNPETDDMEALLGDGG